MHFVSEITDSIILLDLKIPPFVKQGDTVKMECVYDLEYDGLYRQVSKNAFFHRKIRRYNLLQELFAHFELRIKNYDS